MNALQQEGHRLFDSVYEDFAGEQISSGFRRLISGLRELRCGATPEEWQEFSDEAWQAHLLARTMHEEPITRRAFEKPRGYAGDAELIDLIYGISDLPQMSAVGAALHNLIMDSPAVQAVRERRDHLAGRLDEVAAKAPNARVLSVACGHLREAQKSVAVGNHRFAEFIGLDQDRESIALVDREQSAFGVKTVIGSVRSLLKGKVSFQEFDFVYSTGLYDYLSQPVATDLTSKLFAMLSPGGELLVANFLPNVNDVAYMETFMDWPLICRNENELADVASGIPSTQIAAQRTYRDVYENVAYLQIEKR